MIRIIVIEVVLILIILLVSILFWLIINIWLGINILLVLLLIILWLLKILLRISILLKLVWLIIWIHISLLRMDLLLKVLWHVLIELRLRHLLVLIQIVTWYISNRHWSVLLLIHHTNWRRIIAILLRSRLPILIHIRIKHSLHSCLHILN